MKRTIIGLLGLAVFLCCFSVLAQESPPTTTPTSGTEPVTTQKNNELTRVSQSPVLAGTLSIVPGLGQMYNKQYLLGGLWLVADLGLYATAIFYTGAFTPGKKLQISVEGIFLFAIAGGLHLFSIYDATTEAIRINENLEKFSVAYDPSDKNFIVAYRFRF